MPFWGMYYTFLFLFQSIFNLCFSFNEHVIINIVSSHTRLFRWVCTSGLAADLETSDRIAREVLEDIISKGGWRE